MKSPLNYQVSNIDNSNAALEDSLMFLFEREEMPLEILKALYVYSVECYNKNTENNVVEYGKYFMETMSKYIIDVLKTKNLNFKCVYSKGETVALSSIIYCVKNYGCACVKVWKGNEPHYVTVTAIDSNFVYLFDPCFEYDSRYNENENVKVVLDKPFNYNRKVRVEHFVRLKKSDYCLGDLQNREAIIFLKEIVSRERELE